MKQGFKFLDKVEDNTSTMLPDTIITKLVNSVTERSFELCHLLNKLKIVKHNNKGLRLIHIQLNRLEFLLTEQIELLTKAKEEEQQN